MNQPVNCSQVPSYLTPHVTATPSSTLSLTSTTETAWPGCSSLTRSRSSSEPTDSAASSPGREPRPCTRVSKDHTDHTPGGAPLILITRLTHLCIVTSLKHSQVSGTARTSPGLSRPRPWSQTGSTSPSSATSSTRWRCPWTLTPTTPERTSCGAQRAWSSTTAYKTARCWDWMTASSSSWSSSSWTSRRVPEVSGIPLRGSVRRDVRRCALGE